MKKRRSIRYSETLKAYCFLAPAILLIGIFFFYPLGRALYMSFFKWPIFGNPSFVAMDNYIHILQDENFRKAFWFTLLYTSIVTPALFVIAFILANMVNQKIPGTTFFRSLYFTPVVMSFIATSLIWLWIYHDLYGILNYFLVKLNLITEPVPWMTDPATSIPTVVLSVVWKMAGFTMIILLAGMQSIPDSYYESATIFGAKTWQATLYITIPLLKTSFALALIISIAGSVLAFDQFVVMTQGGPAHSTRTLIMYIYETSFVKIQLGVGAAMSMITTFFLILMTIVQLYLLRKKH